MRIKSYWPTHLFYFAGNTVIYYGDEFGKANDEDYYKYQVEITGHDDTRNLVRGKVDWQYVTIKLDDKKSFENKIFNGLKSMIKARKDNPEMIYGSLKFLNQESYILAFEKQTESEKFIFILNLSDNEASVEK
jgi:glycosidase